MAPSPVNTFVFLFCIFYFGTEICSAVDSMSSGQFLRDPESIISSNSKFRLGFFSPPNSTNRYVGIWYNQPSVMEVVWVANKDSPLTDTSGMLKLSDNGFLSVSTSRNETLWSSNITLPDTRFSAVQLLNSGNLVVQGFESEQLQGNATVIWQSFQHPTDSVLPNMRFLLSSKMNLKNVLQAWKSPSDPSTGRFALGTSSLGLFQLIIWDGDRPYWRSGPWNGNIFIGTRYHNVGYGNIFVNTGSFTQDDGQGVTSLVYTGANESLLAHYALSYQGIIAQRWWTGNNNNWLNAWHAPEHVCDTYGKCGVFGSCNPQGKPICSCLKGFEPKNKEEWKRGNWTSGCVRRKQLQCRLQGGKQDGFLRLQMMKVPDNAEWTEGLNRDQCGSKCSNNCSCLAYSYDTALACMTWGGSLIDIANLSPGGVDLYIRLAKSELASSNSREKAIIAASVSLGSVGIAAIICILVLWRWRTKPRVTSNGLGKSRFMPGKGVEDKKATSDPNAFGDRSENLEDLKLLEFEKLAEATNGFNESNLLGSGGFGKVYKGILEDKQTVAVKRLSRASGQGIEEFMNEAVLISKLQHRNLVKLLGCCVEGEEKMLIYEYMPNKSLDAYLFDAEKRKLLNWEKCFSIIEGICRGLLYLHRDSRLKIIHRDLKSSNILLDEDMNPKISDFGMARIFGGNQDQASTQRVVGTYGYMSPEYAMEGHFSEKSDVYSFGVLLLEIVCGKRNSSFRHQECLSLLGYAWQLWNEGEIDLLIDPLVSETQHQGEIRRCIHVGLLCVQEFTKDRPSISTVISMLGSEIMDLPNPKGPGFIRCQISSELGTSTISDDTCSTNYVTVTQLTAR